MSRLGAIAGSNGSEQLVRGLARTRTRSYLPQEDGQSLETREFELLVVGERERRQSPRDEESVQNGLEALLKRRAKEKRSKSGGGGGPRRGMADGPRL